MKKRAFTLMELLVVIIVIGILAAIGILSYSGQQKKAREARRISDIGQISDALQQYVSMGNNVPQTTGAVGTSTGVLNVLIASNLLAKIPEEPLAQGTSARCTSYMYEAPTSAVMFGSREYGLSFHSEIAANNRTTGAVHPMNNNLTTVSGLNYPDPATCNYPSVYLFGPVAH